MMTMGPHQVATLLVSKMGASLGEATIPGPPQAKCRVRAELPCPFCVFRSFENADSHLGGWPETGISHEVPVTQVSQEREGPSGIRLSASFGHIQSLLS
jgi:hypothetical protein